MKIDHILFPVDFSDHSRALNTEVEWLAARFDARVTLLHVFEVPTSWYGGGEYPLITSEDVTAFMDAEKTRLAEYKLGVPEGRIRRVSAEGSAAWHIANLAAEADVDLIVMGTHGYGTVRRLLLGSVAMKVLHDVRCPVWMHSAAAENARPLERISTIVCAIELTDEAVPLLRFVKQAANEFEASVRLIHRAPGASEYKYLDSVLHEQLIAAAHAQLRDLQAAAGTDFPITFTEKPIGEGTAELAVTEKADLIFTGRGKAQLAFGTLRTHAYEIVRQAPCPVLSFVSDRDRANEAHRQDAQTVVRAYE